MSAVRRIGASEGIRTLDTHVGNVMLYQAELRSLPESVEGYASPQNLQAGFQSGLVGPPSTERITLSKSSWSIGLWKNATAPLLAARSLYLGSSLPVMIMMGIFFAASNRWIHSMTRKPSHGTPSTAGGKPMSSRIKSGLSLRAAATASEPSNAVMILKPAPCNFREMVLRMTSLSSTTRTFFGLAGADSV